MTRRRLAETEDREVVLVGATQPGMHLGLDQAREIVGLRLEQLSGGLLLSDAGISRLTQRLVVQSYRAGDVIIKQGVRGDFLGVVGKGQVAIHAHVEDSSRALVQERPNVLLLPGGTFGEAMLVEGRPCGSLVHAVTDAEVYILRRADFLSEVGTGLFRSVYTTGPSRPWLGVAAIAFLLASIAAAAFVASQFLFSNGQESGHVAAAGASVQIDEALQIVSPLDGAVLSRSASLPVRAALVEPGSYQASLEVDGVVLEVQLNPDPETVPWVVDLPWIEASEGEHRLAVQAYGPKRELKMSGPVTVTVVPTGTLAFASSRDGPHAIYAMGTDGRRVSRLTFGPGDARQPAWGSDRVLVYVTEPEVGQAVIRRIVEGTDAEKVVAVGRDVVWSPDGTRLAFSATVDDVSQVFTATPDSGSPVQVTAEVAYAGQPSWSPDGMHLAYVAQQEGNWDIWAVNLDGSERRRLTKDPAMDWAPAWSPDGQGLAFVSNRGGSHQVHFMRSDGSGVRILTDFAHGAESPSWSPDGSWLTFVAYTGEGVGVNAREIYLMRSDGRNQVRLTHNAFDDTQPDWQPTR